MLKIKTYNAIYSVECVENNLALFINSLICESRVQNFVMAWIGPRSGDLK